MTIAAAALVLPLFAFGQARKPIDKAGLFKAVELKGLSTDAMVRVIADRGVDFRLTGEDEQQLVRLGAERRLIEAIRENYRGEPEPKPPEPKPPEPKPPEPPPAVELPGGPPLTENQVILLLQAGVAHDVASRLIEKRGVDFAINRRIAGEILAAGGTSQTVGLVTIAQRDAPAPPRPAAPGTPLVVPEAEQQRKRVRAVPPQYPPAAQRQRVSGAVRLQVLIGADGGVRRVEALSGPPLLRQAAVDAVKQWLYQPTVVDGRPVEVLTEVELNFTLKQ